MSRFVQVTCPRCKLSVEVHAELARAHRDKIKAALEEKKAQGHALGRAPYGWKLEAGQRIPVPHEQDIVRLVQLRRAQGRTLSQVADELERLGYHSRVGRRFSRMQISRIERGPASVATGDEGPRHKEEQLPLMLVAPRTGTKALCPPPAPSRPSPRIVGPGAPRMEEGGERLALVSSSRSRRGGRALPVLKGQLELF